MSNPLFDAMGGNRKPTANNGMNQFMQQLQQFRQSVQGNPQQIIQQKLQSGQITQAQVDSAFQMARSMGLIR